MHGASLARFWVILGVAVALMLALNAQSLSFGWFGDDYVHRRIILEQLHGGGGARPWWNLFDDRAAAKGGVEEPNTLFGRLPWWTSPSFSFALLRPLSAASQLLDYTLWPNSPWRMHAHNLALFALLVCLAGVLYRRLLGDGLACWIALVAYAIDDSHTIGNAWIASRNTLLVALFGLLSLWAFDVWRRDGARWGAWLAALALACAHASSEGAIALWAYFLAYELFLDARPWRSRALALAPLAAISCAFYWLSASYGYGVHGSGVYIDPRADPLRFALVAFERLPDIVRLQFGLSNLALGGVPPSLVPSAITLTQLFVAVALVIGLRPSWRSGTTRYFALSAVLTLLPHCSIGALERLMYLSGFAAHGLIALALAGCIQQLRAAEGGRKIAYGLPAAGLLVIHGVVVIFTPAHALAFARNVHQRVEFAARSLPHGAELRDRTIMVLNYPDYLTSVFVSVYRHEFALPGPRAMYLAGTSSGPVRIRREAPNVLELQPLGGYFHDPSMNLVRPPDEPFHERQLLPLGAAIVRIDKLTTDARPDQISLLARLDDPSWLWVAYDIRLGRFVPIKLPKIGEFRWLPSHVP
ncbi:MAG TPA: hypothetical protein VJV78_36345 [Polyangiales bacterium]|nr:hypothetical protein [Polyangiales bacterium]